MQCNEFITPAIARRIGATSDAKLADALEEYADDETEFGQSMFEAIEAELADREDQYAADRGAMNGVAPRY